jgi:hypothetical protein
MSHFPYPYLGNKRQEIKYIIPEINEEIINNCKNIIEPFCGSSVISFELWKIYPNHQYHLNDLNINIYNLLKEIKEVDSVETFINNCNIAISGMTKERYNYIKSHLRKEIYDVYEYIAFNKGGAAQYYRQPIQFNNKTFTQKKRDFIEFIKSENVHIYNKDWQEIYNEYNTPESLFIMDPPYLMSCNEMYKMNENIKLLNPYEYFYKNNINSQECKIMFILEDNWIIRLLFGDNIKTTYAKIYAITKKETSHAIITNF